jgi:3-oxoacyl-[acyl-carrier-protein] synthase II
MRTADDIDRPARVVVVTGIGVVSAVGATSRDFWDALIAGRSGLSSTDDYQGADGVSVIGRVEGVSGQTYLRQARHGKVLNRTAELLVAAAALASRDAGLDAHPIEGHKLGVIAGIGPNNQYTHDILAALNRSRRDAGHVDIASFLLAQRIEPLRRLRHLPNIATALVAIEHHAGGPCTTLMSGNISGLQAIIEGWWLIHTGVADAVLCGSADSRLDPVLLAILGRQMRLSARSDPEQACRPFDENRSGTVPAEGAAVLLLESYESARTRRVRTYAEVVGGTSAGPGRLGGGTCGIEQVIRLGMGRPIDVVMSHGDGGVQSDLMEAAALAPVVNHAGSGSAITSIKGHIGHTMSAAGSLNAAAACLVLASGTVPAIRGLQRPCAPLRFVIGEPVMTHPSRVLVIESDPSGAAAALLLSRPQI